MRKLTLSKYQVTCPYLYNWKVVQQGFEPTSLMPEVVYVYDSPTRYKSSVAIEIIFCLRLLSRTQHLA